MGNNPHLWRAKRIWSCAFRLKNRFLRSLVKWAAPTDLPIDDNVRFSNRVLLSSSIFPSFVVITSWVTFLYVVGFAKCAGCHKHWSERTGEAWFGASCDFRFGSKADVRGRR